MKQLSIFIIFAVIALFAKNIIAEPNINELRGIKS